MEAGAAALVVWRTGATGAIEVSGLLSVVLKGVLAVAILAVAGAFNCAARAAWIASGLGAGGLTEAVTASGFVIEVPRLKVGCEMVLATFAGRAWRTLAGFMRGAKTARVPPCWLLRPGWLEAVRRTVATCCRECAFTSLS